MSLDCPALRDSLAYRVVRGLARTHLVNVNAEYAEAEEAERAGDAEYRCVRDPQSRRNQNRYVIVTSSS